MPRYSLRVLQSFSATILAAASIHQASAVPLVVTNGETRTFTTGTYHYDSVLLAPGAGLELLGDVTLNVAGDFTMEREYVPFERTGFEGDAPIGTGGFFRDPSIAGAVHGTRAAGGADGTDGGDGADASFGPGNPLGSGQGGGAGESGGAGTSHIGGGRELVINSGGTVSLAGQIDLVTVNLDGGSGGDGGQGGRGGAGADRPPREVGDGGRGGNAGDSGDGGDAGDAGRPGRLVINAAAGIRALEATAMDPFLGPQSTEGVLVNLNNRSLLFGDQRLATYGPDGIQDPNPLFAPEPLTMLGNGFMRVAGVADLSPLDANGFGALGLRLNIRQLSTMR